MNAQVRVIVGSGRGATAAPRLLVLTVATALTAFLSQAGGIFPAQFGTVTNFPVGGAPGVMVVADFNHDGRPDVAVTRAGAITLLPGLGNGAFGAPTNASSTGAQWLAEGDFNNDGNMDLLAAAHVGSVLLGDGQGSFPVRTNYTGFYASYVSDVMGGDFSGDGNLDLAIANTAMNSVTVAFGRGDGSFGPSTNYYLANNNVLYDIRTGDISGNGRLDLALSLWNSGNSNAFCVLMNKGDGSFAAPQYYAAGSTREHHPSMELRDLNGDGRLDTAVLNSDGRSVTVFLNTGGGRFGAGRDYPLGFSPTSIASADFNGDGKTDLIVRGGATAAVLYNHGDGSFDVGAQMSVPADSGSGHGTIAVGDFNGDGMPDLAFANYSGKSVAIMLNQTPPILQITPMAGYSQISWLATFGAGFTLECTTNLLLPNSWQPFPYPPVMIGNQKAVTDWADRAQKFYRLTKP